MFDRIRWQVRWGVKIIFHNTSIGLRVNIRMRLKNTRQMYFKKFSFIRVRDDITSYRFLIGKLEILYLQIFLVALQRLPSFGESLERKLVKVSDLCLPELF